MSQITYDLVQGAISARGFRGTKKILSGILRSWTPIGAPDWAGQTWIFLYRQPIHRALRGDRYVKYLPFSTYQQFLTAWVVRDEYLWMMSVDNDIFTMSFSKGEGKKIRKFIQDNWRTMDSDSFAQWGKQQGYQVGNYC